MNKQNEQKDFCRAWTAFIVRDKIIGKDTYEQ